MLDALSALAFAIETLHSTITQQIDGASCHPACLLTLHCALPRCVVKGILQVPHARMWLLREMAQATLCYNRSKLASTPRTLATRWEVARMYSEPKSVDLMDTCFFCDGTPNITCHGCKVLHSTFMRLSCVNQRHVFDCANFGRPTLLLLLLHLLLLLLLMLTLVLVDLWQMVCAAPSIPPKR